MNRLRWCWSISTTLNSTTTTTVTAVGDKALHRVGTSIQCCARRANEVAACVLCEEFVADYLRRQRNAAVINFPQNWHDAITSCISLMRIDGFELSISAGIAWIKPKAVAMKLPTNLRWQLAQHQRGIMRPALLFASDIFCNTALRSSPFILPQSLISCPERIQPTHRSSFSSSAQMLTQGESARPFNRQLDFAILFAVITLTLYIAGAAEASSIFFVSLSSRFMTAGEPTTKEPSGISMPSGISALAPTIQCHRFWFYSTPMALMPIKEKIPLRCSCAAWHCGLHGHTAAPQKACCRRRCSTAICTLLCVPIVI